MSVHCRGEVSDAMMAALGLDVGANLSAEERFKQVAAVMKRRDAHDRRDQKELRRQQKLDKKVIACFDRTVSTGVLVHQYQ